jgi:hypothetical protein
MRLTPTLWLSLALAACTLTASVGLGGFADVVSSTDTPMVATDAGAGGDSAVLVDVTPLTDVVVAEDVPADVTGPSIAWGERCARRSDNCAAPAG